MTHVLTSPWGLLVFGRVGELGEEAKLVPFLLLEDRGHIFPSIPFYHLKIALYPQKPSPVHFWAPGRGKKTFFLIQTALCLLFSPPRPTLGLSSPTLPSLICTPYLSHPVLYKYVHVCLILDTDPQFLVQKPGGQTSCGIQNISDFRDRFSIQITYYKTPSGTRASILYVNSLISGQLDRPIVVPSWVNEEGAAPWAMSGQALLPNEL